MRTIFFVIFLFTALCGTANSDSGFMEADLEENISDKENVIVGTHSFQAVRSFSENKAPAAKNGKWGFIDKGGEWVLPPVYEDVQNFMNGEVNAKYRGLWVRVTALGKIVKPAKLSDFYVKGKNVELGLLFKNGKVGYASEDLKKIIKPQFDDGGPFSEGRAPVCIDGKWGLIDTSGTFILEPRYGMLFPCKEGLCPVLKDDRWGFVDLDGKLSITNRFEEAKVFSGGLAPVRRGLKWGYIDKSGKMVISPIFAEAHDFSNGKALGLLDWPAPAGSPFKWILKGAWMKTDGTGIIPLNSTVPFSGLGVSFDSSGKYGVMDGTATIIEPQYSEIGNCGFGFCVVRKDSKYGYLSLTGTGGIEPEFEEADLFCGNFARVKSAGKYGIINASGSYVVPAEYESIDYRVCDLEVRATLAGRDGTLNPGNGTFQPFNSMAILNASPKVHTEGVTPELTKKKQTGDIPLIFGTSPTAGTQVMRSDFSRNIQGEIFPDKAQDLIAFKFASENPLVPAKAPVKVDVFLKKRFNGKIRIYPTNTGVFTLLDMKKGEYLKSVEMQINSLPGKIGTVTAGILVAAEHLKINLGSEVIETSHVDDKRYRVLISSREIVAAPPGGDWYDGERTENMLFMGDFAAVRAMRILGSDKSAALYALPQLVDWFGMSGKQGEVGAAGLKAVIKANGCGDVFNAFDGLLKSKRYETNAKKEWMQGIRLCGTEAIIATGTIKMFFEDEDKGVRDMAFALYRDLGLELPLKFTPSAGMSIEKKAEFVKNINDTYRYAIGLSSAAPLLAMEAIEKTLENTPEHEEAAKLYLLLGKLKKGHENNYDYAKQRPDEYWHNGIGDNYIYEGKQFKDLIAKFPGTQLVEEAAYALTELSRGGECEGFTDCYIERGFSEVKQFLKEHPNSKYADEAVSRANEAFASNINEVKDVNSSNEYFDGQRIQTLLQEYEDIAATLPVKPRLKAYLTIADLWVKFLHYEPAKTLYLSILADAPQNENIKFVKDSLAALPTVRFVFSPAKVVGYSIVALEWEEPPVSDIKKYVVYRSSIILADTGLAGNFSKLVEQEETQFIDRTILPDTEYWYYAEAVTPEGKFRSNKIQCKIPDVELYPRQILFNQADSSLYVFGYTKGADSRIGAAEAIRVTEDNIVKERLRGAFYGIEEYFLQDHKYDRYAESVWLIDHSHQSFLTFNKSSEFLAAMPRRHNVKEYWSSMYKISPEFFDLREAPDEKKVPYYGLLISIGRDTRQLWIEPRAGIYSLDWDEKNGICWAGSEGQIGIYDKDGNPAGKISVGSHEFVTAIFSDVRDGTAWAYLSRKGVLAKISRAGAIQKELPVPKFAGGRHAPLAIDPERNHIWVWEAGNKERKAQLTKLSLDGGIVGVVPSEKFSVSKYDTYNTPYITVDKATGNLWVLNNNNLYKFDASGKLLSQSELWPLPGRFRKKIPVAAAD